MALNIQKCLNAALMPAAVVIVVGIVLALLGRFVPAAACLVGLPGLLINIAVLAWAGFRVVKEMAMDLVGGAVTGAIAGFVAGLVGGIINIVLMLALGVPGMGTGAAASAAIIGVAAVVGLIAGMVVGLIEGAICGAIGAFVAGMKK